jgi:hypothetical protein
MTMRMSRGARTSLFLTSIFLALSTSALAVPINIGGTDYVRLGNFELDIVAPFGPAPAAVSTSTLLTYHGFVEVQVGGVGETFFDWDNDAFYIFAPIGPYNDPWYYQLALDTAPITGQPGTPTPLQQLARTTIVYDIAADVQVTPVYVPAYEPNHVYRFVIDTTLTDGYLGVASLLHFGVANGIYSDNTGNYRINVWQLEPAVPDPSVPEPSSLALLGLGLLLAFRRRRA